MTITPSLTDAALAERVMHAEMVIIGHVRSLALHDPFWESIAIHYASDEVAVTVVNLVEYAEDARSGARFGPELLHDVRDHIAFLRANAGSAASDRAVRPRIPLLVVYRDGDTARERLLGDRPAT